MSECLLPTSCHLVRCLTERRTTSLNIGNVTVVRVRVSTTSHRRIAVKFRSLHSPLTVCDVTGVTKFGVTMWRNQRNHTWRPSSTCMRVCGGPRSISPYVTYRCCSQTTERIETECRSDSTANVVPPRPPPNRKTYDVTEYRKRDCDWGEG